MSDQPIYNLKKSKVDALANKHIRGIDKWYRMYCGIASELVQYRNGILYLKIENTGKQFPSDQATALKFARSWANGNPELMHAKGYVVAYFKTSFTGFMIDSDAPREALEDLSRQFKEASEGKHPFIDIFSGQLA